MALNPNEAPEGCAAQSREDIRSCVGCHYQGRGCPKEPCSAMSRADGCNVIFVSKFATANWPYDDMGTPVEVTG